MSRWKQQSWSKTEKKTRKQGFNQITSYLTICMKINWKITNNCLLVELNLVFTYFTIKLSKERAELYNFKNWLIFSWKCVILDNIMSNVLALYFSPVSSPSLTISPDASIPNTNGSIGSYPNFLSLMYVSTGFSPAEWIFTRTYKRDNIKLAQNKYWKL